MIVSEEVRCVSFDRTLHGYRCEDVDDYLKQVADSMDEMAAENEELQKKLVVLAQRIDQYRAEEDTLRTTLINAQRLGDNVIKEAKQKAAEIIRTANIKAEDREQQSRSEVDLGKQELKTLKREADNFKRSLMTMYRKHIELLSSIPEYSDDSDNGSTELSTGKTLEQGPISTPISDPYSPVLEPSLASSAPVEPPYEPQPEFFEDDTKQIEPEPVVPIAPVAAAKKIDTVEFVMTPRNDDEEDLSDKMQPELQTETDLYEAVTSAEQATLNLGRSGKKTSRKTRTPAPIDRLEEDLPPELESFSGVDFDQ